MVVPRLTGVLGLLGLITPRPSGLWPAGGWPTWSSELGPPVMMQPPLRTPFQNALPPAPSCVVHPNQLLAVTRSWIGSQDALETLPDSFQSRDVVMTNCAARSRDAMDRRARWGPGPPGPPSGLGRQATRVGAAV